MSEQATRYLPPFSRPQPDCSFKARAQQFPETTSLIPSRTIHEPGWPCSLSATVQRVKDLAVLGGCSSYFFEQGLAEATNSLQLLHESELEVHGNTQHVGINTGLSQYFANLMVWIKLECCLNMLGSNSTTPKDIHVRLLRRTICVHRVAVCTVRHGKISTRVVQIP